jgi:signal transduction histidine kinase
VHIVEMTARQSLVEMRHLVSGLRSTDARAQTELSPHGIEHIEELIDVARTESYVCRGIPVPLTFSISNALFRVAQEAITNARRHAVDQPIDVILEYASTRIVLTVTNPTNQQTPPTRSGFGILGMTERMAAVGGALTSERQVDMWRVVAVATIAGDLR